MLLPALTSRYDMGTSSLFSPLPLLATATADTAPSVLNGVLLSLVAIYLASKIGAEMAKRFDLPPILGELVAGVTIGISGLQLIIFADNGMVASDSAIVQFLQLLNPMTPTALAQVFESQSEVISVLGELGVIILLFEIGLESDLRQLKAVVIQAVVVACVGVAVPFALGTIGLMTIFHIAAIPAIFAGAALTATSIGITSKVLSELVQLVGRSTNLFK